MLGDVRERLGDDEVDRSLDLCREAVVERVDLDRDGRALGQRADGRGEPMVGQHRRVNAAGELPKARRAPRSPRPRVSSSSSSRVPSAFAQQLQRHADPEQPLLRSVVKVALEPTAFFVAGSDDPRPRVTQLGKLGAELGLEPLVLEREARRGADRLEQRGLVEEHGSCTIAARRSPMYVTARPPARAT